MRASLGATPMVTPPNMAELQAKVQSSPGDHDRTSKQDDEIKNFSPLPTSGILSHDETVSPDSSSGLGSNKQSESNIPLQNESMVNILHLNNIEGFRAVLSDVMENKLENKLRSYSELMQNQLDKTVSSLNESIKKLENAVSNVNKNVASIMQSIPGSKVPNRRLAGLKEADSAQLTSSSVPSISGNTSRSTPDSTKSSVGTGTPFSQTSSRSQSTDELTTAATSEYNLTQSVSSLAVQSYTAFPATVRRYMIISCLDPQLCLTM